MSHEKSHPKQECKRNFTEASVSKELTVFVSCLPVAQANQLVNEGSMTAEDYLEAQHKLHVDQEMALEQQEEEADQTEAEQLNGWTEVWTNTTA